MGTLYTTLPGLQGLTLYARFKRLTDGQSWNNNTSAYVAAGMTLSTSTLVAASLIAGDDFAVTVPSGVTNDPHVVLFYTSAALSVGAEVGQDVWPSSAATIAAAVWTLANAIEGAYTPTQTLQWLLAVLAGRIADVGGATEHYKDPTNTNQRVAVTFDTSKNRTTVSLT